eukprot:5742987-Prymnesium_polylepis.1
MPRGRLLRPRPLPLPLRRPGGATRDGKGQGRRRSRCWHLGQGARVLPRLHRRLPPEHIA